MIDIIIQRLSKAAEDTLAAPIIKEQIALLEMTAASLEKKNETLEKENATLRLQLQKLDETEKKLAELQQFEDLGLIKIKLDKHGKRLASCYCPQCGGIVLLPEQYSETQIPDMFRLGWTSCLKKCGFKVGINALRDVLSKWDLSHPLGS